MSAGLAIFISILIFIGFLVILSLIHELGHFTVAKLSKTKVAEFSIGFGPKIFQIKWGETTYSLRWILLGGYVSVLSDDVIDQIEEIRSLEPTPEEVEQLEKKMYGIKVYEDLDRNMSIDSKSYPTKLLFTLGGVLMNFMIAWVALFVGYMITGKEVESNTPQIAFVADSGNAYGFQIESIEYEVQPGVLQEEKGMSDIYYFFKDSDVTEIDINFVRRDEDWSQTVEVINLTEGKWETKTAFTYDELTVKAGTEFSYNNVTENNYFKTYSNGWEALGESFVDAWIILGEMFVLLFDIMTLGMVVPHDPWMHSYQGETAFAVNYNMWSMMFVDLSLLLFAFNIIPLPPLDGWKATEYTYEIIRGKKVKKKTVQYLTYLGYAFIALTFFFSFFVGIW